MKPDKVAPGLAVAALTEIAEHAWPREEPTLPRHRIAMRAGDRRKATVEWISHEDVEGKTR